jgi:tRNA nucleotidyltransferase (CCA-adding enzyme)
MSDYMFMLDSHLNGEQSKALVQVRQAAEHANLNLFLTGGAMRDMMGGFPIRDLDFTIEGPAVKFAKALAQSAHAEILSVDDNRKTVELRFPGDVTACIAMARQERYPKPGAKPQVQAATIHEDLRGRDFTVNAIALSLGKASRGLLLDPANGLGDLSHKELRAISNYALYDDPARIFRMLRLRVRLGFTIDERTMNQYRNVREVKLETKIPAAALEHELRQIGLVCRRVRCGASAGGTGRRDRGKRLGESRGHGAAPRRRCAIRCPAQNGAGKAAQSAWRARNPRRSGIARHVAGDTRRDAIRG